MKVLLIFKPLMLPWHCLLTDPDRGSSDDRKFNQGLWRKIFQTLLNIPSCEEIPDLSALRRECEEYFVESLLPTYNKQINKVVQKLDSLLAKWGQPQKRGLAKWNVDWPNEGSIRNVDWLNDCDPRNVYWLNDCNPRNLYWLNDCRPRNVYWPNNCRSKNVCILL